MSPPMMLVSLGSRTASARGIGASGSFGVSILSDRLLEAARFGAASGVPKFVERFCLEPSQAGDEPRSPAVAEAIAHIDCDVTITTPAGDHTVFIGKVNAVMLTGKDGPLLYYARSYRRLSNPWPTEELYSHW
jgi:flavin reductase (DIM6/NTAB) family NADH-FMN oxidoreductase RutF